MAPVDLHDRGCVYQPKLGVTLLEVQRFGPLGNSTESAESFDSSFDLIGRVLGNRFQGIMLRDQRTQ
jgi:hypothetical protein